MNELLIYLFKVIGVQLILYVIYLLVFSKSGRHSLNRIYIIFAVLIAFIIPLIAMPSLFPTETIIVEESARFWLTEVQTAFPEQELIPIARNTDSWLFGSYALMFIPAVSILLLMRLFYSIYQLLKLKANSRLIQSRGFKVFESKIGSPFSYFSYIFIPEKVFSSHSYSQILRHERVHVNKKHSWDRLFFELLLVIFWFNPVLYLYRKRLIEVHEFQADEGVLENFNDPVAYQELLYEQLSDGFAAPAANYFSFTTIKKRIKMINQTKKQSTWLYSLSLPAFLVLLFIFSGKESTHHLKVITDKVTETVAAVAPQNEYKPSILPLKNVEDVTLKSSFGMRIHPVLKVEKMHEGVDFKTQEGNVVLATAKGTVIEAGSINKIGGLKVVIDHNGLYQTAYAHLSEIKVKKGDEVKLNDEIGLSGRTGQAVAPHLHYEVKETGRGFVDPLLFINDFYFNPQKNTPIKKEEAKEKPVKKAGQKFRVVIDPGHGGADKGTNSSELWEKDIVLKIALDIAESFVDSDKVEIMLSRRDDQLLSLDDRVLLTENADLFISLHVEDHENQEERMMVPIYRDVGVYAEQSKMFADLLAAEFTKENKEIRVAYTRGYKVLENAKCPAILFNIGYVSNKDTDHYLNSKNGRDEVATEISDAISAASL